MNSYDFYIYCSVVILLLCCQFVTMYPIVISKKESGSCNKWWLISNMLYKKKNCYTFCRNTDLIVYFILRYPKMFDLWFLEIWFGLQKNVIKNLKGYETSKRYISKQSYIRFKIHTRNLNALLYHNDNNDHRNSLKCSN